MVVMATQMQKLERYLPRYPHVWYLCGRACNGCQFCHGGLSYCVVCNGFEGQLLSDCPGVKLGEAALEACYSGQVVDLPVWRVMYAAGLRRVGGQWIRRVFKAHVMTERTL